MLSLIDQFSAGLLDLKYLNFENTHFKERLDLNRISSDYVMDLMEKGEFNSLLPSEKDKGSFVLYCDAPEGKDYAGLKIIIKEYANRLNFMTIYPDNFTLSNRRSNSTKSLKRLKNDKLKRKAGPRRY